MIKITEITVKIHIKGDTGSFSITSQPNTDILAAFLGVKCIAEEQERMIFRRDQELKRYQKHKIVVDFSDLERIINELGEEVTQLKR